MSGDPSIPVTVIGGFLGAGKTTLLNAIIAIIAATPNGRRLGVLVNDFGSINIDADLVVGVEGNMVSLGGGCICCSIRDDMASSIFEMVSGQDRPEHLLIEASGVSDPAAVARALVSPQMQGLVQLDGVVVAVDAEAHLHASFRERIVAGGQLKAADIVVLTKVDLLDEEQLAKVEHKVRRVVSRARIVRAVRGDAPLELLLGLERVGTAGAMDVRVDQAGAEQLSEHDAAFSTWSYTTDVPLSPRRLKRVVDALPPSVFRVKGIVQVTRDRMRKAVLHVVGRRAELELGASWGDATPRSQLVFIGAPGGIDPEVLTAKLQACEAPENDEGNVVTRWLRKFV